MDKKSNVLLPVSGAVGVGLLCGLYAWNRAARRAAPRKLTGNSSTGSADHLLNPAGWVLIETELFRNLQFLPH